MKGCMSEAVVRKQEKATEMHCNTIRCIREFQRLVPHVATAPWCGREGESHGAHTARFVGPVALPVRTAATLLGAVSLDWTGRGRRPASLENPVIFRTSGHQSEKSGMQ
eukprot:TRINITY_DN43_c0_g1_i1.p1 TRINITY_DN43_c0_g1~~TRINITY_DN43_c0_g1_i1.p1  ORF type:complete len:109 (+),score=3.67 TRINITY_DN43_c0_g1_i1:667-993(+)